MAIKAADGVNEGQIAVTEDELRELNNTVRTNHLDAIVPYLTAILLTTTTEESLAREGRAQRCAKDEQLGVGPPAQTRAEAHAEGGRARGPRLQVLTADA